MAGMDFLSKRSALMLARVYAGNRSQTTYGSLLGPLTLRLSILGSCICGIFNPTLNIPNLVINTAFAQSETSASVPCSAKCKRNPITGQLPDGCPEECLDPVGAFRAEQNQAAGSTAVRPRRPIEGSNGCGGSSECPSPVGKLKLPDPDEHGSARWLSDPTNAFIHPSDSPANANQQMKSLNSDSLKELQ